MDILSTYMSLGHMIRVPNLKKALVGRSFMLTSYSLQITEYLLSSFPFIIRNANTRLYVNKQVNGDYYQDYSLVLMHQAVFGPITKQEVLHFVTKR